MQDVRDGDFTLIDHDPQTGRCVWMAEIDGQYVFRVDMPLEGMFVQNHEALMATMGNRFGDYNRFASVPLEIAHHSGVSEAIEQGDDRFLSRWFNDPDNRKFRTSRGTV